MTVQIYFQNIPETSVDFINEDYSHMSERKVCLTILAQKQMW